MSRRLSPPLFVSLSLALGLGVSGCTVDTLALFPLGDPGLADDGEELGDESGDDSDSQTDSQGDQGSDDAGLDLPDDDDGGGNQQAACTVEQDLALGLDAALPCDALPPSLTFAPSVAWTWTGPGGEDSVLVTPLVANLDDDNDDGGVDLCDVPDIVVVAVDAPLDKDDLLPAGHLYVIDSRTGETKLVIDHPVDPSANPAIADLDGDGSPEILAFERSIDSFGQLGQRRIIAFEADGSVLWISETWVDSQDGGGLAVADLDADGSPEILAPEHVLTATGALAWLPLNAPPPDDSLPIAADLDLDGDLEVLFGASVYDDAGELLFELDLPNGDNGNANSGALAIANFDDDPEPEIYSLRKQHLVFEHDGSLKASCGAGNAKLYPVAIVDQDGDGKAEILAKHGANFRSQELETNGGGQVGCSTRWQVKAGHGVASAFDFLADGGAEAIITDLDWVRILDQDGGALIELPRTARESLATPVIADADNDGAAELLITGSEAEGGDSELEGGRPSLWLIQNTDDRFAPTRRIWNQHAYHATNIREDGSVPAEPVLHFAESGPNSFRANPAPSYAGSLCQDPTFE